MMLAAALELAHKGLAVFPCRPRDKRPAAANGSKAASTDPGRIEHWWRAYPDHNIAIATGAISGVFVVDVDGLDAEAELRKFESAHGELPASVEAITARGRHVYLKMPNTAVRNSAGKIAPGIDVRANGGYVLAPPSIHPSGRRYAWSVDSTDVFADAPDWLLCKITAPTGNDSVTLASEWRELVQGVAEGARDCSVARLAGLLLRRQIDPLVVLELLQSWNATRCTPPLSAADVTRIVNSIAGRELKRRAADGG